MKRHASQASSADADAPKAAPPIATNDELNAILTQYKNAKFLAVDTEFLRERTYYPQLCLIQISDGVDAVRGRWPQQSSCCRKRDAAPRFL